MFLLIVRAEIKRPWVAVVNAVVIDVDVIFVVNAVVADDVVVKAVLISYIQTTVGPDLC